MNHSATRKHELSGHVHKLRAHFYRNAPYRIKHSCYLFTKLYKELMDYYFGSLVIPTDLIKNEQHPFDAALSPFIDINQILTKYLAFLFQSAMQQHRSDDIG